MTRATLVDSSWQAFERLVCRLLLHRGYTGLRIVGQSGDQGADVIAHRDGKRWLAQVKHWRQRIPPGVIDSLLRSLVIYRAQVPVLVALNGVEEAVSEQQVTLQRLGTPLQVWTGDTIIRLAAGLEDCAPCELWPARFNTRPYQEHAIQSIVDACDAGIAHGGIVVLATGLGKTYVAAEALRRLNRIRPRKVLALVHSNELVYQLERSFWPFMRPSEPTVVWNGYERPGEDLLESTAATFACVNTVYEHLRSRGPLPEYDVILVDECHHMGAQMYDRIFEDTRAGREGGPFALGLTATPWRADEIDLGRYFGDPLITVDLVAGLKHGFLTNVDYRMYTDNIDWEALKRLPGRALSPRSINRTLFINQWDDAVVQELRRTWSEQPRPRAIVFCGTIDHAMTMRDRINALGFCSAAAIYSQAPSGRAMTPAERSRVLCDFHDGVVQVVCAVDIFNEGVDVPDVNIIVFQRVTHSRRIFVQQLGRGLRLAPEKEKVIVLDFVSDIRRFAAGLHLKDKLAGGGTAHDRASRVSLPGSVVFRKVGGEDPKTESFLRQWLEDAAAIEAAGEDTAVLKFPPDLPGD